ncbi:MAG: DMT family transporter [Saccharofermentans sp.]|nr:DMT family transporter [Saccharofermentans sp.]
MRKTSLKGVLILLLTAVIWGSSFVAQEVGMESIDAFTYTAIRTILGALMLLPVVLIVNKGFDFKKSTLLAGVVLGIDFSIAQNFQQFAFYHSTSGKIAFITAFYMFFVPLFSLFLKKKVRLLTWAAILLGLVGLFLLCINPEDMTAINRGDIQAFFCAVFYAVQIMLIDYYVEKDINGIQLSFMQFVVAAIISSVLMFIFETPTIANIKIAAIPLAYSGIMSCGIAYTLQIIGQKHTSPVIASLLMCLESVFAVISAALILHQVMSLREGLGCIIMFVAIILSQLAEVIAPKKNEKPATN